MPFNRFTIQCKASCDWLRHMAGMQTHWEPKPDSAPTLSYSCMTLGISIHALDRTFPPNTQALRKQSHTKVAF